MKTKSIIIILACVLAAAFALGAMGFVRLGGEEPAGGGDRLIGILVTTEYLDLFDNEAYIEENIHEFMSGSAPDTSEYQGRLYAQLADRTDYDDDGAPIHSKEYVFPDSDGVFCYAAKIDDGTGEPYTTTGGDGVSDVKLNINCTENGKDLKYEGVVSVNANAQTVLCFNPVYQTAEGEVYAVSGDSFEYTGGDEGDVYGITLDEKYTVTENGSEITDSFTISVQTRYTYPAQTVSIIQMDADSAILSRNEYALNELPEALEPDSSTEYIIVESHSADRQRRTVVDRKIYRPADFEIEVYADRGDGICIPRSVALRWPQTEN